MASGGPMLRPWPVRRLFSASLSSSDAEVPQGERRHLQEKVGCRRVLAEARSIDGHSEGHYDWPKAWRYHLIWRMAGRGWNEIPLKSMDRGNAAATTAPRLPKAQLKLPLVPALLGLPNSPRSGWSAATSITWSRDRRRLRMGLCDGEPRRAEDGPTWSTSAN
jgi:hypothetical protein